uniref:Uncharacterized protein MANES_04G136000 n=1 Tax=Rhizophora mucronata TaxID=61149 RepID=A0A2P2MUQ3_RHIMU
MDVRSFPQGTRNCYTLKPPEGKARIYLIRASFMYGNYDNQDRLPRFDLYVGVNKWDSVKFDNASHIVIKEIIHIPVIDNIYVCLLNTGSGTPFISALEVRHYHNSTYQAEAESASLDLYQRLNFGSTTNEIVRFPDDVYDRIWTPYDCPRCASRGTNFSIDSLNGSVFNLPSKVMRTAALPINVNDSLHFEFDIGDPTLKFYVYMHFAELQSLQGDQYREFNITLNGNLLSEVKLHNYLHSMTILSPQPVRGANLSFSLYKSEKSTLPPILNAMEIYIVRDFLQAPTDEEDGILSHVCNAFCMKT